MLLKGVISFYNYRITALQNIQVLISETCERYPVREKRFLQELEKGRFVWIMQGVVNVITSVL